MRPGIGFASAYRLCGTLVKNGTVYVKNIDHGVKSGFDPGLSVSQTLVLPLHYLHRCRARQQPNLYPAQNASTSGTSTQSTNSALRVTLTSSAPAEG